MLLGSHPDVVFFLGFSPVKQAPSSAVLLFWQFFWSAVLLLGSFSYQQSFCFAVHLLHLTLDKASSGSLPVDQWPWVQAVTSQLPNSVECKAGAAGEWIVLVVWYSKELYTINSTVVHSKVMLSCVQYCCPVSCLILKYLISKYLYQS